MDHVTRVLDEIGAAEIPHLVVLNKIDRAELHMTPERASGRAAAISALTGAGVDALLRVIDEVLPFDPVMRARFRFPAGGGRQLDLLHRYGRVLDTRYEGEFCEVDAETPESLLRRLAEWAIS